MRYNLYLDESKYIDSRKHVWYCIGGVIVSTQQMFDFRRSLGRLKHDVWGNEPSYIAKNHILHEAEIRNYSKRVTDPAYKVFEKNSNVRKVVNGVGDIIDNNNLTVLGCVLDETSIEMSYHAKQSSYSAYKICLQTIIESYTHFLKSNSDVGNIILESRRNNDGAIQDDRTRKQFYKILAHGTLLYTPAELQKSIYKLAFVKKQENEAGLQIADFVPRPFLLHNAGASQKKPSIYQVLRKHRYNGGNPLNSSLGMKVIQ